MIPDQSAALIIANAIRLGLRRKREREIALLVAAGMSDKEIATAIGVSVATVKSVLGIIYRLLDFEHRGANRRRIELVRLLYAPRERMTRS